MNTPVWLLDIDGVINAACREPDTKAWPEEDWNIGHATNGSGRWKITWSSGVIAFISRIHDSGRAEIRWHTTWQSDAQTVADLTGLPVFDIALAPEFYDGAAAAAARWRDDQPERWWKLGAAERVIAEEGRPLIWTDDDIADSLWRTGGVGHQFANPTVPALLVSPRVHVGLRPSDLATIELFLSDLRENL